MATLLQIDFPMQGPWGDEMADAFRSLAELIGQTPGLRLDVNEPLSTVNRGR